MQEHEFDLDGWRQCRLQPIAAPCTRGDGCGRLKLAQLAAQAISASGSSYPPYPPSSLDSREEDRHAQLDGRGGGGAAEQDSYAAYSPQFPPFQI